MADAGLTWDSTLSWIPDRDVMLRHIMAVTEGLQVSEWPRKTWDESARVAFYGALKRHLDDLSRELVGSRGYLNPYFYVKGLNKRIPASFRGSFFGSACYPDAAFIVPGRYAIAIELDHGTSGIHLRGALARASFNVLVGSFDCALVVFDPEGQQMDIKATERRVLGFFKEQLSTWLVFVGGRPGDLYRVV